MLIMVFILQIIIAIVVFAFRESLSQSVVDELKSGIRHSYNETDENGVYFAWNGLQENFMVKMILKSQNLYYNITFFFIPQCCGVQGPDDWFGASAWPTRNYVPDSCCLQPRRISGIYLIYIS